jgi:hypothetical protein
MEHTFFCVAESKQSLERLRLGCSEEEEEEEADQCLSAEVFW